MRARLSIALAFATLFWFVPAVAASAQPGNDDFEAATPVGAIPFEEVVDVTDATVQADEPDFVCAPMGNTVWYGLTLEEAMDVTVDTAGSDYDTVMAVYTGSDFFDFEVIDCVDDTIAGLQAAVTFGAEAGVTYWVQVGAFDQLFGPATLNISFDEPGKATGKPTIFKSSFRGLSASAWIESFDENGVTFGDLRLVESRDKFYQERPYKNAWVEVWVREEFFDEGAGTFTFTEWFGYTELEGSEYELDKKLQDAYVMTTMTLFGTSCTEGPYEETPEGYEFETECVELGPVDVALDVVWEGSGPVFQSRYMDRWSTEGFRSSFMMRSTNRDASVTGGFADDEVSFDFTGAYGQLSREASAEMVVIRGAGPMAM
jgi:hypothetical protein